MQQFGIYHFVKKSWLDIHISHGVDMSRFASFGSVVDNKLTYTDGKRLKKYMTWEQK